MAFTKRLTLPPTRLRNAASVMSWLRSWMTHHQGMSLLGDCEFPERECVQNWFHRDARVQATELLLQERPVRHVPAPPGKSVDRRPTGTRVLPNQFELRPEICLGNAVSVFGQSICICGRASDRLMSLSRSSTTGYRRSTRWQSICNIIHRDDMAVSSRPIDNPDRRRSGTCARSAGYAASGPRLCRHALFFSQRGAGRGDSSNRPIWRWST